MQRHGTQLSGPGARAFAYTAAAFHDLRYAARALRRNASFAAVAVLMLALGIGAATAMFTIVNSVLLRPLPYFEPDRVVALWTRYLPESGYDFPQFSLSGPEFLEYRSQARTFADVAAYMQRGALLAARDTGGEPLRLQQILNTVTLFKTLGVQPELGRGFVASDGDAGADCVVVLSHGLWIEAFGGDPDAVGRSTRVDNTQCTIAGVMPKGFAFPNAQARLWRNLPVDPAVSPWTRRLDHNFSAVGRLAAGVTLAQAEAETRSLMAGWKETYPDHHTGHFVFLRSFADDVVGDVRPELTMLLAAVGLMLLIICANLASLLLARGESRRHELGVRLALGSGRARLVTQLLGESFVLAAAGGALGMAFAVFFLDGLLALYPGTLPRAETITVDLRAFAFAALATATSGLLFGLVPALRSTSSSTGAALVTRSRGAVGHGGGARLMRGLVVAEVALSVTLVAGAGLLLRSYENIRGVDLGFNAAGVYTVSQALPASGYPTTERVRAFYSALLEKIGVLPGVQSVGAVSSLPLTGGTGPMDDFRIEGRALPQPGEAQLNAGYVMATPGYFETLGVALRAGRSIEAGDRRDAPWVAVINEQAARQFWPNEDPIGRRLYYRSPGPDAAPQWITVVGVVENTRVNGAERDPQPQIFVPHAQMPREQLYPGRSMTIVVRAKSGTDPLTLAASVRTAIGDADRSLPLIGGRLMEDIVGDSVGQPRFTSLLVSFFAVVALLLGALGIHGVLSYVVAQRGSELGVRLALGAQPAAVLRMVIGQGMRLTLLGVVLGVIGALAAARLFQSLLFGVAPIDAVSFGIAVAVLGTAAFVACYGPARRAARIDPMRALRAE